MTMGVAKPGEELNCSRLRVRGRLVRRVLACAALLLAAPPAGAFELDDSLRGSTSSGNAIGGSFGDGGWTVTARTDRIWWSLPTLVEGSIEFTITNLSNANLFDGDNEIFGMYEAGYGIPEPIDYSPEFRNNHYKILLRIYGPNEEGRPGEQKLIFRICPSGAPGYDACGCTQFEEEPFGGDGTWDGTPQRLRVEWGDGIARYLRNDVEILEIDWTESGLSFGPSELHFSIGTSRPDSVDSAGMPIGAVFSDVSVRGTEGPVATCGGGGEDAGEPDTGPVDAGSGDDVGPGDAHVLGAIEDATANSFIAGVDPNVDDLAVESAAAPTIVSYLKFDARGLSGTVTRATLVIRAHSDGSADGDGAAVHPVEDDSWSEATLTWANRPAFGLTPLGETGSTEPDLEYTVDVTGAVRAGELVSLALVAGGDNGSHFSSSEDAGGSRSPRLEVTVADLGPGDEGGAADVGSDPDAPGEDLGVPPDVAEAGGTDVDNLPDAPAADDGTPVDTSVEDSAEGGSGQATLEGGGCSCGTADGGNAPGIALGLLLLGLWSCPRRRERRLDDD